MTAAVKGAELLAQMPGSLFQGWAERWLALYAKSPFQFTVFTLAVVVTVGAFLGMITDFIIKRLGIELNSREVREK
jgi:hypothetical protein